MSVIEKLKTTAARLRGAREAIASSAATVRQEIAKLREELAAKRAALKLARTAPIPRDEIPAAVAKVVRDAGDLWLRGTGEPGSGAVLKDGHGRAYLHAIAPPTGPSLPEELWGPSLRFGMIAAADPEMAARWLTRICTAVDYVPGPAAGERAALVAQLEREVADLERTEEEFVDTAVAEGVEFAHRPEVVKRRQDEADAQARADQKAKDAAAVEAWNEAARHQGQPRPTVARMNPDK